MKQEHGGAIYGENRIRLDFSVNTNPLGMPKALKEAVAAHPEDWSRYPDSRCMELKNRLSAYYNQSGKDGLKGKLQGDLPPCFLPEHFICGNGAADLIYSLAFALRPRRALLFTPSFSEYESALLAAGCELEKLALKERDGFALRLPERMKEIETAASHKGIDIVFLCNPNNPTGQAVRGEELEPLVRLCQDKGIFLVVDECFNWFINHPGQYSAANMINKYSNLMILNAFTKIFSMAGLRLGYGICGDRSVFERLEACRQPWSVSGAAMRAGAEALLETEFVKKSRDFVEEERKFLADGLRKLGFMVCSSRVNYLLFRDRSGLNLYEYLKDRGILIRSCESFEGLGAGYYRVAVRLREENKELLVNLKEILAQAD